MYLQLTIDYFFDLFILNDYWHRAHSYTNDWRDQKVKIVKWEGAVYTPPLFFVFAISPEIIVHKRSEQTEFQNSKSGGLPFLRPPEFFDLGIDAAAFVRKRPDFVHKRCTNNLRKRNFKIPNWGGRRNGPNK